MKKLLAILTLLLAPVAYAKSVSNIAISPQGAVIQNGASLQFSVTCTYSDNSVDNCAGAGGATWSSSWTSRMSVSATGVANAIKDPLTDVSPNNTNRYLNQFVLVSAGGVTARAGVYTQHAGDTWYRYPTPDYRSFTTYGAQNPTLNVAIGSRVALGEGFLVNNTDGGNGFPIQSLCTWSSSDPTKATVDNDARVTALAPGVVTFTCNIGGNGNFGSSTQGGWQAPGNVITLNIVPGGTGSATWYVRPDGGTPYISSSRTPAGQCNGHTNAPYSGHGTNQNCALGNLSFLWADQVTPNNLGWIISGGDTVIVAPNANRYTIGKTGVNCAGDPGYNCFMPTIPSGTASRHTRILGSNYASCRADSAKSGLTLDLQASAAFNITDSQFVDVACFEITDAAACSTSSNFTNHCTATDHFGQFGIVEDSLASATLTDLAIHGLAAEAIHGPSGPDVVADHIRISGMPFGGIDMDNAAWHSTNISSAGGFTLTNSVTEFTGCVEEYPVVHNYPYIECRDQNTGGYGDGLGTANTSGDWVFDHDVWRYNFQDGLDLLHSGMKSLSVTNSQSYGNDGQQYKIGSGQKILFANNTAVGNCERILAPFGDEPSSAIIPGVTGCRAAGDGILISMAAVGTDTFLNNTYVGYGNTSYDMACESGFETCPNAQSTYQNNINVGIVNSVYQPGVQPGLFYTGSPSMPANNGWAVRDHNLYFNFRNGNGCPAPLNVGEICADAQFVNEPSLTISSEAVLDNFDFSLSATSRAKYAGIQLPVLNLQTIDLALSNLLGTDLLGTLRHLPPSIGALEFGSSATSPSAPAPPAPPAPPTAPAPPVPPTKQSASLSLSISPTVSVVGQTITLAASVSSTGTVIPTGTVSFSINGTTLSASLDGTGRASVSVGSLPANTYAASAAYPGDTTYLGATSNAASVTITPAPVNSAISVAIGQPSFGFNLIPGSVRRIFANVTNGVTNQVNWTVKSGGAKLSATSGSWVDVTAPATGSPCMIAGPSSSPSVTSNSTVVIEAVSAEDSTRIADLTLKVCKPTVELSVVPAYRTLYANQAADLQSLLVGSTNDAVTWAISATPTGGDGKLVDTTSRDTVFAAASPGRYFVTATSKADASKIATAVLYVTGRPMPYRVTQNRTEPIDCTVDPLLRGQTFEVGPSQAYKRLQDVPLTSMPAGSTIRLHNEDASGTSATTFNEYVQLEQAAPSDQPIRLCGVPDQFGNLPIVDGNNASGRSDTYSKIAGAGLITIGGTAKTTKWPTYLGAQSIIVEGVHLRNARPDVGFVAPAGGSAAWSPSAACLLIGEGHDITVAGVELENCATGGASIWGGPTWNTSSLNHLWEGNYIHANAAPGAVTNQQLDLQAWGEVVQFNRLDGIAAGSLGANLKSRGLQDVIRYNYFGDGAARELDLADVQNAAPFMSFANYFNQTPGPYSMDQLAAWQEAWNEHFVYGNLYQNTAASAPVHFGYDLDAGEPARKGNLYWYNNTFSQPTCATCSNPLTLFDQSDGKGVYLPQVEFPTIQAMNNVVWTNPALFAFSWNDFDAFIAVGGNNVMAANWGTDTLQGGVGDGWDASPNAAAYQGASRLPLHITGFTGSDVLTAASMPFDSVSWLLTTPEPGSTSLPAKICEMPTRFAYLPGLGFPIARTASPNAGATDTVGQAAAVLRQGMGAYPSNTMCQ